MTAGTPGEARTVRSVAILTEELGRRWITAWDYDGRWGPERPWGVDRPIAYANRLLHAAWRKGFLRRELAKTIWPTEWNASRYAYALPEIPELTKDGENSQ